MIVLQTLAGFKLITIVFVGFVFGVLAAGLMLREGRESINWWFEQVGTADYSKSFLDKARIYYYFDYKSNINY